MKAKKKPEKVVRNKVPMGSKAKIKVPTPGEVRRIEAKEQENESDV